MPSTRLTLLAVSVAAPAAAGFAPSAGASTPVPQRPHSRVATFDRAGVRVLALQVAVHRRAGGRLGIRAVVVIRNRTGGATVRWLRAGACPRGPRTAPVCPTAVRRRTSVAPHATRRFVLRGTLPAPPRSRDAVQVALVPVSARQPYQRSSDAILLLTGRAWRGRGAGRTYGLLLTDERRARRLSFDIPATGPGTAYVYVLWEGASAPSTARTEVGRCRGATCAYAPIRPTAARSGPGTFGRRFDFAIRGADAMALRVRERAQDLISARLPWPGR